MHEIITIQFGNQANYVGTHYWNTQESYFTYGGQEQSPINHDISWQQGTGVEGDTYTPRLLIYDLKGAFGSQRHINELYQVPNQPDPVLHNAFGRNVTTIRSAAIPPNPYLQAINNGVQTQLEPETVRYWSDYNRVFYHPKSTQQSNEYELNNPLTPFTSFEAGEELFNKENREREILDTDLRPFMEQCDHISAIQLISSIDDAWGGFCARYREEIGDEYGNPFVWMFALSETVDGRGGSRQQAINHIKTIHKMVNSVGMFLPLTRQRSYPSYMNPGTWRNMPWYHGALRSMLIESMTLPTRLRQGCEGYSDYARLGYHIGGSIELSLAAASMSILEDKEDQTENRDPRMLNGLEHDVDAYAEKVLDIDFFPTTTTRQTQGRLWSTYEFERSRNPTVAEYYSEPIKHLDLYSPLLHPHQTSFPQLTTFSTGQYSVKTALTTSDRIAGYINSLAHLSQRVLDAEEREDIHHELLTLGEDYKREPDFEDDDDQFN